MLERAFRNCRCNPSDTVGASTSNPLDRGILAKLERAFALRDELRDAQVNHRAVSGIASNALSRAASPSLDRRDVDQRAVQPCLVGSLDPAAQGRRRCGLGLRVVRERHEKASDTNLGGIAEDGETTEHPVHTVMSLS